MNDFVDSHFKNVLISTGTSKKEIELKPPNGYAVELKSVKWMMSPLDLDSIVADSYVLAGISKYPIDNVPATPTTNDIALASDIFNTFTFYVMFTTSGVATGLAQQFYRYPAGARPVFIINPSILYRTNITLYLQLEYEYIKVSQREFNLIATWQGGFKERGAI